MYRRMHRLNVKPIGLPPPAHPFLDMHLSKNNSPPGHFRSVLVTHCPGGEGRINTLGPLPCQSFLSVRYSFFCTARERC
jgi:hypothetical protein